MRDAPAQLVVGLIELGECGLTHGRGVCLIHHTQVAHAHGGQQSFSGRLRPLKLRHVDRGLVLNLGPIGAQYCDQREHVERGARGAHRTTQLLELLCRDEPALRERGRVCEQICSHLEQLLIQAGNGVRWRGSRLMQRLRITKCQQKVFHALDQGLVEKRHGQQVRAKLTQPEQHSRGPCIDGGDVHIDGLQALGWHRLQHPPLPLERQLQAAEVLLGFLGPVDQDVGHGRALLLRAPRGASRIPTPGLREGSPRSQFFLQAGRSPNATIQIMGRRSKIVRPVFRLFVAKRPPWLPAEGRPPYGADRALPAKRAEANRGPGVLQEKPSLPTCRGPELLGNPPRAARGPQSLAAQEAAPPPRPRLSSREANLALERPALAFREANRLRVSG
jgi:hypothetical protein